MIIWFEVMILFYFGSCMTLNIPTGTVISVDMKGIIEYWDGDSLLPLSKPDVLFEYKSETDLYDLAKVRVQLKLLL